jgi:hypothetical protein
MKPTSVLKSLFAVSLISVVRIMAGETVTVSGETAPPAPYEANRGLITLEGPTGLFINPTSATLPKGAFTAQYCFFLPDHDFKDAIGHGFLLSYGVTDWLEFGGIGNIVQDTPLGTIGAGGPMARLRLLKHKGLIPQFSIGAYGKIGSYAFPEQASIFAVFTERFEVNKGPLISVAVDAGMRQTWTNNGSDPRGAGLASNDSIRGYFGLEVQLPARIYVIGEVATNSSVDQVIPWAAGLQFRAGGVNVSVAALEPGDGDDVGFYFGIGTQLAF